MNLVCISQILLFCYILKSSNFIVRVINLETFTSLVPSWVISKSFQGRFTILNLSEPNKIKSTKECIHSLSIMTMPFLLFIIPLIYGFWNNLSIWIHPLLKNWKKEKKLSIKNISSLFINKNCDKQFLLEISGENSEEIKNNSLEISSTFLIFQIAN